MIFPSSSDWGNTNRVTAFSRGSLSSSGNNASTLDTITSPSSTQSWSLDAIGNQTAVATDGTSVTNTTNAKNELTTNGTSSLAFDNNGNTTTDQTGNTYTFDAWNHIATVKNTSATTIAAYTYDAGNRRISEAAGGTVIGFYYNGQQIIEHRLGSTVTSQNVFNIDYVNDLLLRDDNSTGGNLGISGSGLGTRLFAQHDANFNATALVNTAGVVQERFVYNPYGAVTVLSPNWTSTSDTFDWQYLYQDMWQDSMTGLYYTVNRDYDVQLARWDQSDPTGFDDGSNTYVLERDQVVNYTDPRGLSAQGSTEGVISWKVTKPTLFQSITTHGLFRNTVIVGYNFGVHFTLGAVKPECYEYRQYVEGGIYVNNVLDPITSGLPTSLNWHEDALKDENTGVISHFGHRSEPGDGGDVYSLPNRATGTDYVMVDRSGGEFPRPWGGDHLRIDFRFHYWLMVVKVSNGDNLADPEKIPKGSVAESAQFDLNDAFTINPDSSVSPVRKVDDPIVPGNVG